MSAEEARGPWVGVGAGGVHDRLMYCMFSGMNGGGVHEPLMFISTGTVDGGVATGDWVIMSGAPSSSAEDSVD